MLVADALSVFSGKCWRSVALCGSAILLAGCQGERYDVDLAMTPSSAGACELPVAVEVQWDVSRLGLDEAKLEFGSLGSTPQLWYAGPSRGSRKTGRWMDDGSTVTLKSKDGVVLAKRTFTTTVCPGKDWF